MPEVWSIRGFAGSSPQNEQISIIDAPALVGQQIGKKQMAFRKHTKRMIWDVDACLAPTYFDPRNCWSRMGMY